VDVLHLDTLLLACDLPVRIEVHLHLFCVVVILRNRDYIAEIVGAEKVQLSKVCSIRRQRNRVQVSSNMNSHTVTLDTEKLSRLGLS
jgi:hypothetical protein